MPPPPRDAVMARLQSRSLCIHRQAPCTQIVPMPTPIASVDFQWLDANQVCGMPFFVQPPTDYYQTRVLRVTALSKFVLLEMSEQVGQRVVHGVLHDPAFG